MMMNGTPGPAYDFHRTDAKSKGPAATAADLESLEYSSYVDSESYLALHPGGGADESVVTGHVATYQTTHPDATDTIHEMHLALLYLLTNPEEFQKALAAHPARGATTLAEWNEEYDNETEAGESLATAPPEQNAIVGTPLPFVVFADDAEVVLPQAHTASQLFGVERLEGIELEAAAGIPALSQLFLRWLALMPAGDHLNIIDPPGLTVMRIAGGRYRVTAAHRVVWTWMNEFAPILQQTSAGTPMSTTAPGAPVTGVNALQIGDLVTMTIVDVFETDSQGKLLSYCPTFDNRAIHKTHHTAETLRRSSTKVISMLGQAKKSKLAIMIMKSASSVANSVKQQIEEALDNYSSPHRHHNGDRRKPSLANSSSHEEEEERARIDHQGFNGLSLQATSGMQQQHQHQSSAMAESYTEDEDESLVHEV